MGGLMFVLSVVAGLFILVLLVVIHELGHAIVARRNGVKVDEFGIGFPPAAKKWKVKKSFLGENVVYSLNWLPIGGFVSLHGENAEDSRPHTFGHASFWSKTKIMFAGVAMNWLSAIVLFTVLAWIGMPKLVDNQFTVASDTNETRHPLTVRTVSKDSPAERAGLQTGDVIKSINEQPALADIMKATKLTKENAGKMITVEYARGDQPSKTVNVQLNTPDKAQNGYLGVAFSQDQTTLKSTWSAPIVGVGLTGQLSWETLKGLGGLLVKLGSGIAGQLNMDGGERAKASQQLGDAGNSVAGPVGIVFNLLPGAVSAGIVPILLISAVLSLTLAVMNVLPIPALDGGRWYLMALYKVMKKPLTKEKEESIVGTSMLVLFGLIILITLADVTKLFR